MPTNHFGVESRMLSAGIRVGRCGRAAATIYMAVYLFRHPAVRQSHPSVARLSLFRMRHCRRGKSVARVPCESVVSGEVVSTRPATARPQGSERRPACIPSQSLVARFSARGQRRHGRRGVSVARRAFRVGRQCKGRQQCCSTLPVKARPGDCVTG